MTRAELLDGAKHLSQLPDKNRPAVRLGETGDQLGARLLIEGDQSHGHRGAAQSRGDQTGVDALAGDQHDGLLRVKRCRKKGRQHNAGWARTPAE